MPSKTKRSSRRKRVKEKPIYVRAFIPDYAEKDVARNEYVFWYVGSHDPDLISEAALHKRFKEFAGEASGIHSYNLCFATFCAWLEQQPGYLLFNSTPLCLGDEPSCVVIPWAERIEKKTQETVW